MAIYTAATFGAFWCVVLKIYFKYRAFSLDGHRPYWFSETKDNVCIKIQFNSRRIGLVHQYGRRFFVLEHQYGRRDVI